MLLFKMWFQNEPLYIFVAQLFILYAFLVFAFNNVFVSLWEVLAKEIHTDSSIMEQTPAAHWVFRIRQSTQIDQWDLKVTLIYSM